MFTYLRFTLPSSFLIITFCFLPLAAQTRGRVPSETISIRVSEGTDLAFDISPDGRKVVLCDYLGAGELTLADKPGIAFDEIWKLSPVPVEIGDYRGARRQGEAICYSADGRSLFATSEGSPCPLIELTRRK